MRLSLISRLHLGTFAATAQHPLVEQPATPALGGPGRNSWPGHTGAWHSPRRICRVWWRARYERGGAGVGRREGPGCGGGGRSDNEDEEDVVGREEDGDGLRVGLCGHLRGCRGRPGAQEAHAARADL